MAHIIYSFYIRTVIFYSETQTEKNMVFGADAGIDMNKKGYEIQIVM